MLGKRQRNMPMRRSTSVVSMPSVRKQMLQVSAVDKQARTGPPSSTSAGAEEGLYPSLRRDAFAGVMITAAFLAACGFCGKPLGPGKDTYIYRGEMAFCSNECRERQIKKIELMEQNSSRRSTTEAPSNQSGSGGVRWCFGDSA